MSKKGDKKKGKNLGEREKWLARPTLSMKLVFLASLVIVASLDSSILG